MFLGIYRREFLLLPHTSPENYKFPFFLVSSTSYESCVREILHVSLSLILVVMFWVLWYSIPFMFNRQPSGPFALKSRWYIGFNSNAFKIPHMKFGTNCWNPNPYYFHVLLHFFKNLLAFYLTKLHGYRNNK